MFIKLSQADVQKIIKSLEPLKWESRQSNKEIESLSKHILDLQKDKGNLTDKVRELEQQIEKMKCPWNCKKFGDCKLSICPCDKWELRR